MVSNTHVEIIKCCVPQVSVLGPLLFIVNTNDLPTCLNLTMSILFADDVFIDGDNLNNMTVSMNKELCKLVLWLNINKLSLNIGNTRYDI